MTVDRDLEARLARVRDEEAARESLRRRVRVERFFLVPILLLALLGWVTIGRAKVVGQSMYPTYNTGDSLVILKSYKWLSPLKIGDIVVVRMKHGTIKGEDVVKRVAFIQNERGDAAWPETLKVGTRDVPSKTLFGEYLSGYEKVPRKGIMILGDNLPVSLDSRELGPITEYEVLGKVVYP